MRLISWNVRFGGGERRPAQLRVLSQRSPDLVALQEVTPEGAEELSRGLAALGLPSVLLPQPSDGTRRWLGVLLASRWSLTRLSSPALEWPERALSCLIASPWGEIEVHVAHVPPGSSRGWMKVRSLEAIYEHLAKHSPGPRILCGDFNTPRAEFADGQVQTFGQELEDGKLVCWGTWQGDRGERWDAAERNVLVGLAGFGLPDVFRRLHGYEREEFSHFVNGRLGRRFDHVFASPDLNPLECRYLHRWRDEGLSDHSAVEVVFAPA